MAENSKIEWCDSTFNPWIGCTKVSPGCDHCYAARQDGFRHWTPEGWGGPRKRTSDANWKLPLRWNAETFVQCNRCGWRGPLTEAGNTGACPSCAAVDDFTAARRRVFCASLADVFDNEVPIEWFVDFLDLCRLTPNLDKLLLTKRIGNVVRRLGEALHHLGQRRGCLVDPLFRYVSEWLRGTPPPDIWLGATIVNQAEADRDIPKLLATPARVRFLSMEPLLGPVDITPHLWGRPKPCHDCPKDADCECGYLRRGFFTTDPKLHWGIVGMESGPKARPGHVDWVRSIVQQFKAAGVAVHVKQLGSKVITNGSSAPGQHWPRNTGEHDTGHGHFIKHLVHKKGGDPSEWPQDLRVQEFPNADGVEHNEFPKGA